MLSLLYKHKMTVMDSSKVNHEKAFKKLGCDKIIGDDMINHFTDDKESISYREELFGNFLSLPNLRTDFLQINEILKIYYDDISDMKKLGFDLNTNLRSILLAKCYIKLSEI